MKHGNELLAAVDRNYQGGRADENDRYSVPAVETCLRDVVPPLDRDGPSGLAAFDVWAGYLLLDAWLAGTDRHDENWGAVFDQKTTRYLAPSFDHGKALGFQERPEGHRRMAGDGIALRRWASKGRCRYFVGRPPLVVLARSALDRAGAVGRRYWEDRLAAVRPDQVESVLVGAPKQVLSESSRIFCIELLAINRRRLLDGT